MLDAKRCSSVNLYLVRRRGIPVRLSLARSFSGDLARRLLARDGLFTGYFSEIGKILIETGGSSVTPTLSCCGRVSRTVLAFTR